MNRTLLILLAALLAGVVAVYSLSAWFEDSVDIDDPELSRQSSRDAYDGPALAELAAPHVREASAPTASQEAVDEFESKTNTSDAAPTFRSESDIEALHAHFAALYDGLDRRALREAQKRALRALALEDILASHQRHIADGDFETLGELTTNPDGSTTYPVAKYRRPNEPFQLVQYHHHPTESKLIRTTIELGEVGPTVDALIEFHWLEKKLVR